MASGSANISVLSTGTETYAAMLSDIRTAKTEIVWANFCFLPGTVFRQFEEALILKAKQGVKIYIIADWYGSSAIGEKRVTRLRKAGIDWVWFRPKRASKILSYNRRMHKKLLIIDQKLAYTGGVGVADFWLKANRGYPKTWRDTHFRITDVATARALYNSAAASWNQFSDEPLPALSADRSAFAVLNSRPAKQHKLSPAGRQFIEALSRAKKRVRITTAYFGPSKALRDAIIEAARRGVKIELLLNGPHASHQVAWLAGQNYYDELLKAGVLIFEYQPTKIHAKLMTLDGKVVIFGSANWNFRSLYHDQECNVATHNERLCQVLDKQFDRDLKESIQITTVDHTQRWKQRASSIGRYFF